MSELFDTKCGFRTIVLSERTFVCSSKEGVCDRCQLYVYVCLNVMQFSSYTHNMCGQTIIHTLKVDARLKIP